MSHRPSPPSTKPLPAHATQRTIKLPGESPKPGSEDVHAPDLVQAIINHPNYLEADRDVDFLNQPETRGLRLQLDFHKAEVLLNEYGIAHTIVVFGGTRIGEPAATLAKVSALRLALTDDPGNAELARQLAVAERLHEKSHYYEVARAFGGIVAKAEGEEGNRLVVVTGGGPGMMEAANRGAHDGGARTVGLNITLPHEQYPNPYVTPELCFRFRYFALRKLHFLLRARALVVFPGGFGTLDELFETLTLIQTRKIQPVPVILVGKAYWQRVFDVDFLVDEGVIDPEDRELFWYAETAEEIWDDIQHWYDCLGCKLTEIENRGNTP